MAQKYALIPRRDIEKLRRQRLLREKAASKALGFGIASFVISMNAFWSQLCCLVYFLTPPTFIIINVLLGFWWFVLHLVAIILGGIAVSNGKKAKGIKKGKTGKGFGTAALVISIIMLSLQVIGVVLAIVFVGFVAVVGVIAMVVMAFLTNGSAGGIIENFGNISEVINSALALLPLL